MKWVKTRFLGRGSYGSVTLAEPLFKSPFDPSPVLAVKSCALEESSSLVDEGRILDELRGCHQIFRCFGEDVSVENGGSVYNLLLEYAPGGTLGDLIKARRGMLMPECDVSMYAYMLLKGLQHIHTGGFVNCDLKPANILVFPNSKNGIAVNRLKIADLGLAKQAGCFGDVMIYKSTFNASIPIGQPIMIAADTLFPDWTITRPPRLRRHTIVHWERPRKGFLKLNTDGCSRGNPGEVGGGGIIRTHTGSFVHAYAIGLGHRTNVLAECLALLHGIFG